jgi:hypothetical protein
MVLKSNPISTLLGCVKATKAVETVFFSFLAQEYTFKNIVPKKTIYKKVVQTFI